MLDVLIPYAKETLTVNDSATPLTLSVYKIGQHEEIQRVYITVEDADIRYWTDGSDPVADSEGHLVTAGSAIELTLHKSVTGFRAIRNASTDAVLQVTYERDV
jgi:hypothetical protein